MVRVHAPEPLLKIFRLAEIRHGHACPVSGRTYSCVQAPSFAPMENSAKQGWICCPLDFWLVIEGDPNRLGESLAQEVRKDSCYSTAGTRQHTKRNWTQAESAHDGSGFFYSLRYLSFLCLVLESRQEITPTADQSVHPHLLQALNWWCRRRISRSVHCTMAAIPERRH
jgi:hypothetical protein